ncbi:MAG: dihydroneopterin aldolase [Anaerolineales bacterium]
MDRIFIENLRIRAVLGMYEWERHTPQDILVSVSLFLDARPAARADDLVGSVNYAELAEAIRTLVQQARRRTVEALAEDIARLCLSRPGVRKARVCVRKPQAIAEADSAGIEIERRNPRTAKA